MSLGSVHIKIGEGGKEELDITTGYLDKWVATIDSALLLLKQLVQSLGYRTP